MLGDCLVEDVHRRGWGSSDCVGGLPGCRCPSSWLGGFRPRWGDCLVEDVLHALQCLVGDLSEAEQQFGLALRSQLHYVDRLLALQTGRLAFFQQRWDGDLQELGTEFSAERSVPLSLRAVLYRRPRVFTSASLERALARVCVFQGADLRPASARLHLSGGRERGHGAPPQRGRRPGPARLPEHQGRDQDLGPCFRGIIISMTGWDGVMG